ncbi:MAG: LUD domain-containing protein [Planctomycetes bacterium]|nr:LUD domain-containing protein [Planctomycetota bacterium]MCB9919560.1 LUD domain-containing protein [Planctomycetota bacterium]
MTTFAQRIAAVLRREDFVDRHIAALRYKAGHRNATIESIADWEDRREQARALKQKVRDDHERYVDSWIRAARAAGTIVHEARAAAEACGVVLEIAKRHGVESIAKSKSMTTEECELNQFLARHGITVTDTDLGERIVQLFGEPPSHLVMPAIHRSRKEIGELFAREGMCDPGEEDPTRLTMAARRALRKLFLSADLGMTGGNFLVAETGTLVVIENEANSLLGTSLPDVHIAVVGIEKIVPRLADLATFLTVLAPSSTGQRLTTYATHYTGPQPRTPAELARGLAPRELHVVLLDNGRRQLRGTPAEEGLACIRCGACLNVCPVYRRAGGHAYDWTYMGPIGAVLAPALGGGKHDDLPKASSLCGACNDVCPVKIDIAGHLHEWRQELVTRGRVRPGLPPMLPSLLAHKRLWRLGIKTAKALGPVSGFFARRSAALRHWQVGGQRQLPELPSQSFTRWFRSRVSAEPSLRLERGSGPREVKHDDTVRPNPELEPLFEQRLTEAGGELVSSARLADEVLESTVATEGAAHILAARGIDRRVASIDKHELDGTDVLVATARMRIAQKGACWVDFADLGSRAQLLLAETLVLLVPREAIVTDLDEAYARITAETLPSCGAFVTGPSKTADIEQTLVFGAHGPRRLVVIPF